MSDQEALERRREAMFNCSKAIQESIRSYGFRATLDFAVRISNYDAIVSDLLPYLPSIARTAMLEAWNTGTAPKVSQEVPEALPTKAKCSRTRRVRRKKKKQNHACP